VSAAVVAAVVVQVLGAAANVRETELMLKER